MLDILNRGRIAIRRLVAVLGLVILIAAISTGVIQYRRAVHRSKEVVLKTHLSHIRDAVWKYHKDKGRYPDSLEVLIKDRYLRTIPEDPLAESVRWRVTVAQNGVGVQDVHSSARGRASDGSFYSEW